LHLLEGVAADCAHSLRSHTPLAEKRNSPGTRPGEFRNFNFFQLLRQLELCEAFALQGFFLKKLPRNLILLQVPGFFIV
jgi:hypothetical protein